ncbi:MAG: gliding motility-associated C-terminal domain-containing protein [Saprospirales bacterium]|nr:gliding motility-associated C-terminal domain-containing protein [Saprospirales bacterium]MBK8492064.1 gliding motility-associated C-terminal domain-containing protein [Saprospirales bacterium]
MNDRFVVGGNCEEYLIEKLLIFDRWGNQVFEQNDFCPSEEVYGWDGTIGGEKANPGIYAYLVVIEDKVTSTRCRRKGPLLIPR